MRKVSPRLVAIMMASVVSVTSIAPVTAYNHVTVNAAQLQQQAIDWTFTGNGKVDNDKIQLSGAGDNIGIINIKKEDNYAVKAKLTQGEESKERFCSSQCYSIYWSRTFDLFPRRTQQRSSERKSI